jgi:uncharacterized protein YjbJ (UPF0337 family)
MPVDYSTIAEKPKSANYAAIAETDAPPEPSASLGAANRLMGPTGHVEMSGPRPDQTGVRGFIGHKEQQLRSILQRGSTPAVAEFMGSVPLGVTRMAEGVVDYATGHPIKGFTETNQGGAQAMTIPSMVLAGPGATEAAAAPEGQAVIKSLTRPFSLKEVETALEGSNESIQRELEGSLKQIQEGWHKNIRGLFDETAKEANVTPEPAKSLHDVPVNLAKALKSKASSLYKQLDQAIGGTRFQTFDEQIANVKRALRSSAGIDPDKDGALVERINDLETAKAKAVEEAITKGVDPKIIHEANAAYRQGSALEDLSKNVQSSMSGLRSDISAGAEAAPESLSPAKLATRANRMYNTGRLQQAVGENRADRMLSEAESATGKTNKAATEAAKRAEEAKKKAQEAASAVKTRRFIGGAAAAGIGGAEAPKVFEWIKHLLGE